MAYSGGFNTSLCLHWLRHHRGLKVLAFVADLGQGGDLEEVGEKAIFLGAQTVHHLNLKEIFANEYLLPAFRASVRSESGYFLSTALSRPLLIQELVKMALKEQCSSIAHGAMLTSNDYLRFSEGIAFLAPQLRIIAPHDEWDLETAEEKLRYAQRYHIPIQPEALTLEEESNLWGRRLSGGKLLSLDQEPPEDYFRWTRPLSRASLNPIEVTLHFCQGIPVQINDQPMSFLKIIRLLNRLGGRYGIGRMILIDNKLSGKKSHEISESPAALLLFWCHRALEELTLDLDTFQTQQILSQKYTHLVYRGRWFSPQREALDAFFLKTQQRVQGTIRFRLQSGRFTLIGRTSKYSLCSPPSIKSAP